MDVIDPDLVCAKCKKIFTSRPFRLPCDKVVCKHHLPKDSSSVYCVLCAENGDNHKFVPHLRLEIRPDADILKKLTIYNFNKNYKLIRFQIKTLTLQMARPFTEIHIYTSDLIQEIESEQTLALKFLDSESHFGKILTTLDKLEKKCLKKLDNQEFQKIYKDKSQQMLDQALTLIDKASRLKLNKFDELPLELNEILQQNLTTIKNILISLEEVKLSIESELDVFKKTLMNDHLIRLESHKPINKNIIYVNQMGNARVLDLDTGVIKSYLNDRINNNDNLDKLLVKTMKPLIELSEKPKKLIKFIGERYFVIFEENHSFTIWDKYDLSKYVRRFNSNQKADTAVKKFKMLTDDKFVFLMDGKKHVYDLNTNKIRTSSLYQDKNVKIWNKGESHSLKVSKKDNSLILFVQGYYIECWNVVTEYCEKFLISHKSRVTSIELLDDNKLVSASTHYLIIWDLDTYAVLHEFYKVNFRDTKKIKNTPFKKFLTLSNNDQVNLFDYELNLLYKIQDLSGNIHFSFFKFLPNGLLALTDLDGKAKICNIQTSRVDDLDFESSGPVTYMNQLDEKRLIVFCKEDRMLRIWDIERKVFIKSLPMIEYPICFKIYDKILY